MHWKQTVKIQTVSHWEYSDKINTIQNVSTRRQSRNFKNHNCIALRNKQIHHINTRLGYHPCLHSVSWSLKSFSSSHTDALTVGSLGCSLTPHHSELAIVAITFVGIQLLLLSPGRWGEKGPRGWIFSINSSPCFLGQNPWGGSTRLALDFSGLFLVCFPSECWLEN